MQLSNKLDMHIFRPEDSSNNAKFEIYIKYTGNQHTQSFVLTECLCYKKIKLSTTDVTRNNQAFKKNKKIRLQLLPKISYK